MAVVAAYRGAEMPLRFCTFHTSGEGGGGYEEELPEWEESVRAFAKTDDEIVVDDAGPIREWRAATMHKARTCLLAYEHMPDGYDLVWIDVDARVRARLDLFYDWPGEHIGYRWRLSAHQPPEMLSGTLFFKGGQDIVHALLSDWDDEAQRAAAREGPCSGVHGDQNVLRAVVERHEPRGLTARHLPDVYTWIFDLDKREHGAKAPKIEHFQASRRRSKGRGFRGFYRLGAEPR